jgi:hypothetical protein
MSPSITWKMRLRSCGFNCNLFSPDMKTAEPC